MELNCHNFLKHSDLMLDPVSQDRPLDEMRAILKSFRTVSLPLNKVFDCKQH